MDLVKVLEHYVPYNEQEEKDRKEYGGKQEKEK